jgi:CHAD domain-containing protein
MMMSTAAKREMEWQFSADGLEATRAWIARQPADPDSRHFAASTPVDLHDTYYDSADWMIFRAGFALRLREKRDGSGDSSSELTLKALAPSRGGFASRLEISEKIEAGDIAVAVHEGHALAEKVRSLIGERPLVALFHAHTHRERQLLLEAGTRIPLAELDLDQTAIESPGGRGRRLVRIEIECLNAEPAVLAPLVEQLRAAAGLVPTEQSKFRAGLDVAGLAVTLPLALPKLTVTAAQPFTVSQLAILGQNFQNLIDQEPAVRIGSVQAVHEMRVAARHLDTLLKTFAARGPLWATRSRGAVKALVKALGRVRDCDVQIAWLAEETGVDERPTAGRIRARLEAERRDARAALLELLDSTATREWMETWRRELSQPDSVMSGGGESTATVARDLVRALARKLRKRGERIDADSSPEDYHEVRIRAKRLRYAVGAFANLYGEAASDYTAALTKLQDLLGDYHDASVRAQNFRKLASDSTLSGAEAFSLGQWAAGDTKALEKCREKFPSAWRRVRGRRWRALQSAMKQSAAEQS